MIEALYRGVCDGPCKRYVPRPEVVRHVTATEETSASLLSVTPERVLEEAARRGWSRYPQLCPDCSAQLKEGLVTNKIAGLYVSLAKTLNALKEAGEDIVGENCGYPAVVGISSSVQWDPEAERYSVVQG